MRNLLAKLKLFFLCLFIISLGMITSVFSEKSMAETETQLTARLCVDPDWEPYEWIDKNGNFHGIAADLIRKISENANVNFELINTTDWPESIEFAKNNHCSLLGFLNQTIEREQWLDFTNVYFTDPNVFITRQEFEYIRTLSVLDDARVVLPHGTGVEQHLRRNYPNLSIITVESESDALHAVREGEADIAIRSLSVAAYLLRKEGLFDLKIAGELYDFENQFRIGVVEGQNALIDRLNYGISQLTPDDIRSAVNRYVYIQFYAGINYKLLMVVVGIFLLLTSMISFWTLKLKRLNLYLKANKEALESSHDQLQQALNEEHHTNMQQHQFMRMVAHEFRTPLSVIESSCDLLELQASNSPSLLQTVEKQRLSARYLADLVDRSLMEDRMIKSIWQRNAAWISCQELINTAGSYAYLLNQGKHQVEINCNADKVSGDIELMQMMLNNLVENAFKYSPNGGKIVISATQRNDVIILGVEDEGLGISEADQCIIFGKYQRGQHENTPGLGLGLYLVKAIAQLHNGSVRIESELNQGSKFIVTLPRESTAV